VLFAWPLFFLFDAFPVLMASLRKKSEELKFSKTLEKGAKPMSSKKVIITAALAGAGTFKNQNPNVPYTLNEFAEEAHKCWKSGAAMVHVHPRQDDGIPTHNIERVKATYQAIRDKTPELIVNMSSGLAFDTTREMRLAQILAVRPEIASLNTNTMNFSFFDRKSGQILQDGVFENTFTMLQDFGKAMERLKTGEASKILVYPNGVR